MRWYVCVATGLLKDVGARHAVPLLVKSNGGLSLRLRAAISKGWELLRGVHKDLKRRLQEHHRGRVVVTKHRLPLKLVYWEGCLNQADAARREKYLKTAWGKRYLKNRLKQYLTG